MAQIAQTAGVARQTLYNHYADIPAIVTDAVTHHNAEAIAQLNQAMSVVSDPSDAIHTLVRHVVATNAHAGHAPDLMAALPASARAVLGELDAAVEARAAAALEAGVAAGDFRGDLDVALGAAMIRAAIGGVVETVVAAPDDAPRLVDDAVKTLLAGVRAGSA